MSPDLPAERTIYLRVDVDFHQGLRKGVPYLLELFEQLGVKATFLVVMGNDTLHRHAGRVRQRSFRQRMRAMNPARVLLHMGPAYAKSCFRPLQVAGAYPENLRAIGDLIVWNVALTDAEIAAIPADPGAVRPANLLMRDLNDDTISGTAPGLYR